MARRSKTRFRHGIGEWYGKSFLSLRPEEKTALAEIQFVKKDDRPKQECPFQPRADRPGECWPCSKDGGVCSLRLYKQDAGEPVEATGPLVTTCPYRFLESFRMFEWVGEVVLGTKNPLVLDELGFLQRLKPGTAVAAQGETLLEKEEDEDKKDHIGRIDNILVHPDDPALKWCALETQAVYFSGLAMAREFEDMREHPGDGLRFPAGQRRPDYRSSGPKRLLPQLQTKVPTISRWGRKVAVVIDESFFATLIGIKPQAALSNADIAWFIVKYEQTPDGQFTLQRKEVVFATLADSVTALTGGEPLLQGQFEAEIREKIAAKYPTKAGFFNG